MAQSKAVPIVAEIDTVKDDLREFGLVNGETIMVIGSPASVASHGAVSKMLSNFISQSIGRTRSWKHRGKRMGTGEHTFWSLECICRKLDDSLICETDRVD
jgi:hypothetical protein